MKSERLLALALLCSCSSASTAPAALPDGGGDAVTCVSPVHVDPAAAPESPGCPLDQPAEKAACATSGMVCHGFGGLSNPITATCDETCHWAYLVGQFPPPDAGAPDATASD